MRKKSFTVLITGASSGIGREIAIRLAKEGHKVFAGIRRKIDKTEIEKLSSNIKGVYIDVSNQASIDKAFWFVIKNTDKIDVLINNAGIVVAGPVEFIQVKKLREQFEINTFGAVAVAQKFLPLLAGGKIINISSMASSGLFPFISPYCASKRALDILFNSFALENKNNIKVISIKPAAIKTPIWNKSVKNSKKMFDGAENIAKEKYSKELQYLEKNALNNNVTGIEPYVVVDKVIDVINSKNPKSSYNVGLKASFVEFISKFPQDIVNKLVYIGLNKIR